MHSLDAGQIVIPLAILLIKNDEDREFLTQIYEQYYRLLSKVAAGFFHGNQEEIFEVYEGSKTIRRRVPVAVHSYRLCYREVNRMYAKCRDPCA